MSTNKNAELKKSYQNLAYHASVEAAHCDYLIKELEAKRDLLVAQEKYYNAMIIRITDYDCFHFEDTDE